VINSCFQCGYPETHPFGIRIENATCSGCDFHNQKWSVNWEARMADLKKIASNDARCVLIVDSSPESFYSLEVLLSAGFKVVCTHFNSLLNTEAGHENFAKLRDSFDVEFRELTLDFMTVRRIVRSSLLFRGTSRWHFNAGQRIFALNTAKSLGINQIFISKHEGNEQTGMFDHSEFVEMSYRSWIDHDLSGLSPLNLLKNSILRKNDVSYFDYPMECIVGKSDIRGLYLSNYLYWDNKKIHDEMSHKYGLTSNSLARFTLNNFEDIDDISKLTYHNYLKFLKFGYTMKRDHAVQWTRNGCKLNFETIGTLGRNEFSVGDFEEFAQWMDCAPEGLLLASETFINPNIWEQIDFRIWRSRIPGVEAVINHSDIKINRRSLPNSIFGNYINI
jgi:hypothetical protein